MNFDAIMAEVQGVVRQKGINFFDPPEAQFESELRNGLIRAKVPNVQPYQSTMDVFDNGEGKRMKPDIVVGTVAFELSCRKDSPIRGHYKFLRDAWKIEQMVNSEKTDIKSGYTVLLTNKEQYWNPNARMNWQKDEDFWLREFFLNPGFEIFDGQTLTVDWDGNKGGRGKDDIKRSLPRVKCTEANKNDEGIGKLTFCGNYKVNWQIWRGFQCANNSDNRYLIFYYGNDKK